MEPSELQDLGDIMPKLLDLKAKTGTPLRFKLIIELGDGKKLPSLEIVKQFNALLQKIKAALELKR